MQKTKKKKKKKEWRQKGDQVENERSFFPDVPISVSAQEAGQWCDRGLKKGEKA